ncbi:MAG: Crp/Fnr family transcriptional regulator [Clostridia bacterium]|nr:Crp/Fnr family transcriptional regulator [Clostridia bacterium]
MKKYLPVLEKCPLFENIGMNEMHAMLGCIGARVHEYVKNEPIFMEGESADRVGVVLSGGAQIVKEDFYGKRSIVASVKPSQLFGESFACAEIDSLPVSVVATEKSEIMLVDCRRITMSCSNACEFHSRMILNLLRVVAAKNLVFNHKLEIVSKRSTKDKLMTYLLSQAKQNASSEFTIPFDRQSLADYLGVERSALSAEISKMKAEGLIDTNRSWFRLLEPAN